MFFKTSLRVLIALSLFISFCVAAANPPQRFEEAKQLAREKIYYDQNNGEQSEGTLYCGCDWEWMGKSGGRVVLESCGYQVRTQQNRAQRIEWEHIVPAWVFGHQRQCWQQGGRKNCIKEDPVFRVMEADLYNLAPAIGEVNGDRSNFSYGVTEEHSAASYGQCTSRVDFSDRMFEPRDEVKGQVARVYFYMHDRYDLSMSSQQQKLLMAWDHQFPVSAWELERDERITAIMGHTNPFVTGEQKWVLGHQNSAEGIYTPLNKAPASALKVKPEPKKSVTTSQIKGNVRSKIYHFTHCSGYSRIKNENAVFFQSEAQAVEQGYVKAKNCKLK